MTLFPQRGTLQWRLERRLGDLSPRNWVVEYRRVYVLTWPLAAPVRWIAMLALGVAWLSVAVADEIGFWNLWRKDGRPE